VGYLPESAFIALDEGAGDSVQAPQNIQDYETLATVAGGNGFKSWLFVEVTAALPLDQLLWRREISALIRVPAP
jgi:hypothetical protein